MGLHHAVLGEADADFFHIQQFVQQEVYRLVGQRWVAHGGTDALKLLVVQLSDAEVFIGCIAPDVLAHLLVQAFGGSFGQTVGQGLH